MSNSTRNTNSLGRITWLLDRIGNIWFGVTMLVIIFVYSSIGSAAPPIRQGAMADWFGLEFLRFDKSEMEWFSWWPFQVQIALFCLAIILVTLRKIPLTIVNAGVWTIHTGIVTLCVASVIYFGTKVEGDSVIFQSRAMVLAPGMTQPASFIVRPEAAIDVTAGDTHYHISVEQILPGYEILTGEHKGKKTQAIWFNVEASNQQKNFTRVVLVGYPEYTEDVISSSAGMQRVKNITGERLHDKDLQIQLDYDSEKYFYHAHQPPVRSTGAIYARFSTNDEWTQLRFSNLPHYYEKLTHRGELWPTPDLDQLPIRPIDLRPEVAENAGGIGKLELHITDYLPYAHLESRWIDKGTALNPYLRFNMNSSQGQVSHELLAFSPDRQKKQLAREFDAEFVWVSSAEDRAKAVQKPKPRVVVRIESKNIEQTFDVGALYLTGPMTIKETDYTIELQELYSAGTIAPGTPAVAAFNIKHGSANFDRMVIAGESGKSLDMDANQKPMPALMDSDIKVTYLDPSPQRLLLVAGADADVIDVVLTRKDGTYRHHQGKKGEAISLLNDIGLTVEEVLTHADLEIRPRIVPREQRQSLQEVGKSASLVRVEVNDGRQIQPIWLPFSQYAFLNDQWAQPTRFRYAPRSIKLADGRTLSLLYSRWRDPLPAAIALDRFILETHTGGDSAKDYISWIRFAEPDGKWSPIVEVKSNHPAQYGDLWYFQAQWDPGVEAHTVLGVGNRRAVHAMLTGVCISIAGMIYAFYFKPVIIRRRKQAALATAAEKSHLRGESHRVDKSPSPDRQEISHV